MKKSKHTSRLVVMAALLVAALAGLCYRLVDLQWYRHEELRALASRQTRSAFSREPMRGQIRDVRGNPLALSLPAKRVCVDPTLLGKHSWEVARVLAPILQTNEVDLAERLQPRLRVVDGKTNSTKYVVLKKRVSLEEWGQVVNAMTNLAAQLKGRTPTKTEKTFFANFPTAVFAEEDQVRIYPNGALASHVLGFVSNGDKQSAASGIEFTLDKHLKGVAGWRRTERDSHRHEVVAFRQQDVDPRNGWNAVLTIDARLQHILETELAEGMRKHSPVSISGVMVRPRTGEILAMATLPNFDPGNVGAAPLDALRNRVISDYAEPGSTFKIVVTAAGLNERLISLEDVFHCENGLFYHARIPLRDSHPHGLLTVEQIIAKSSNIGAAKIGIMLGGERLHSYIRNFGFGQRTDISLPAEIPGQVVPPAKASKIWISQIPMGQGISVTPLQMVMAMSAMANEGKLMRPILVDRLEDEQGHVMVKYQPQVVRQVVTPETSRMLVAALKAVVEPGGTGGKAKLDHYTVAGKTGTAQKVINRAYAQDRYFSSFIGFFPAGNPEVCLSIVLDDPSKVNGHQGGSTAAPVFRNVAERTAQYLNLRPDVVPPVIAETLAAAAQNPGGAR